MGTAEMNKRNDCLTNQTIFLINQLTVKVQLSDSLDSPSNQSTNLPCILTNLLTLRLLLMYQMMYQSKEGRSEKVGMYMTLQLIKKQNLNKRT